jgi:hypothetical protein
VKFGIEDFYYGLPYSLLFNIGHVKEIFYVMAIRKFTIFVFITSSINTVHDLIIIWRHVDAICLPVNSEKKYKLSHDI